MTQNIHCALISNIVYILWQYLCSMKVPIPVLHCKLHCLFYFMAFLKKKKKRLAWHNAMLCKWQWSLFQIPTSLLSLNGFLVTASYWPTTNCSYWPGRTGTKMWGISWWIIKFFLILMAKQPLFTFSSSVYCNILLQMKMQ